MKKFIDCKEHFGDMYDIRMGTGICPWCRIKKLEEKLTEVNKDIELISSFCDKLRVSASKEIHELRKRAFAAEEELEKHKVANTSSSLSPGVIPDVFYADPLLTLLKQYTQKISVKPHEG